MNQEDVYYEALQSKDRRFDGKFFVGVVTTGIYCRPICPAKPKKENLVFFTDALSAEKAGYRPCLRCHPEFSPGSPEWSGKSEIVQKALKLLSEQILKEQSLDQLAAQLGISSRHLRRLFQEEIGLSPKKIMDHYRLNFAWKLLTETDLSITTAAYASGYSSLRRFNEAFKSRYHKQPSTIRRKKRLPLVADQHVYTLYLPYRPPFDWLSLLSYYQMHQIPYLEKVGEQTYERVFYYNNQLGVLKVFHEPDQERLQLDVHIDSPLGLFEIVTRVRQMFDLDSDPVLIANQFRHIPVLEEMWQRRPGMRIASFWDPFEASICTILGQVVSIKQAVKLTGKLMECYGLPALHPLTKEKIYLFPDAKILSEASLAEIKTTQNRQAAIRELSRQYDQHVLNFALPIDPEQVKKQLRQIRGLGEWSAEYILLRGCGETDAFPAKDLIINRQLTRLKLSDFNCLRPWRGYAAVYLWNMLTEEVK